MSLGRLPHDPVTAAEVLAEVIQVLRNVEGKDLSVLRQLRDALNRENHLRSNVAKHPTLAKFFDQLDTI